MSSTYPQTIFILGTSRDIGKTVTSIGIIARLLSEDHGYTPQEIGYIKPVGQQTLTVVDENGVSVEADKDAVLITQLMGIEGPGWDLMSPVVWGSGVTAEFIDQAAAGDPQSGREVYLTRIRAAYAEVAAGKRIVIVEGTGQPGVGSVAGVSNADVINVLREMGVPVFVAMVTRAGIGATIDQVFPYLLAMDHMGARVDGLIMNDVFVPKLPKVRQYLEAYYQQVFPALYGDRLHQDVPPILGFVPSVPELRLPTMRLVADFFQRQRNSGIEMVAPDDLSDGAYQLISKFKVISLEFGYETYLEPGDAVIVGVNANDVVLAMMLHHERLMRRFGQGLSGLILSCKHVGGLAPEIRELIKSGDLPTMTLDYDSADILQRLEDLSVKIQPYDLVKRDLIAAIYNEHVTLWPELQWD